MISVDMEMWLLILILGAILLLVVFFILSYRVGKKGVMKKAALECAQNIDDGYIGVPQELAKYIGQEAKSITDLRPSGKINIGGEILDAVSVTGFISTGELLKVVKYENSQLYVIAVEG